MNQINTQHCPLCKQPNQCQSGTGSCWCCNIDPVPQALIEQLPVEYRGKACICAHCIERFRQGRGGSSNGLKD
ncbi:MAG: cysteine-rich CWC family protein [Reinekea sp.]